MRLKCVWAVTGLLVLCGSFPALSQFSEFNNDSAYVNLEHLAVTIGPRPMGSQPERAALAWVAQRFAAWGADTAYVMPVWHSKSINTTSGVAVGIFPGRTDSMIVIGGHSDSDFRENPGANDDASGTAVMLELARLWSQRPRHYTLLFAAFGGEEGGLVGSRWFVDHYTELARVALMLQIDMAGSEEALIPFLDTKTHQTPEWLVRDAYAMDRVLGYNSLDYGPNFFTLNSLLGGAGSDQDPFLEKEIPALDFTAGVNTSPIHTVNDRMAFIDKPALARSGRIVDGLLKKYDAQGIPAPVLGHYLLLEMFGGIWFLPKSAMMAIVGLAVLLGVLAYWRSRSRRQPVDPAQRVRFSGSKVFLMVIIAAIFMQLGEAAMQGLKGLRYPWYVPLQGYLIFSALFVLAGFWVGMQLTKRWRFSNQPHVYAWRALVPLLLITSLCWVVDTRLALYPGLTLIAASLTVLIDNAYAQLLFTVLAPVPLIALMFHEAFPLLSRSLPHNMISMNGWLPSLLYSGILTLILILWYFPIIYLAAATVARLPGKFDGLRLLRTRIAGLVLLLVIVAYGGYLYAQPAYNERWRAYLRVTAQFDAKTKQSKLKLAGDEYFRGVSVRTPDSTHSYDDRLHQADWPLACSADWLRMAGTASRESSDTSAVAVDWLISTTQRWDKLNLTLKADTLALTEVTSPWVFSTSKQGVAFNWSAEPPDTVHFTARFRMPTSARLIRTVTATYAGIPVAVEVTAKYADVIYRTEVTQSDTIRAWTRPE